jgi:hypothetical protein
LFLVTNDAADSSGYRFTRDMSGRSLWVRVDGGDLPMPIDICVDQAPDGRHIFTGLRIGGESGTEAQEITSNTLRQIRLGEILAAHFEHFEPIFQMEAVLAADSYPIRPRGPAHQALRDFARTYQIELARQPQRAMTAAAKAHSISRATANRWADLCRQLGYLPSGSGHQPAAED